MPDGNGTGDRPAATDMEAFSNAGGVPDARMDVGDAKAGGAILTIDSTAHDFGMVVTGTTSADATFTVMNTGTAASRVCRGRAQRCRQNRGILHQGRPLQRDEPGRRIELPDRRRAHAGRRGLAGGDLTISGGTGISLTAHLTATAITPGALRISPDTQSFGIVAQNQGSSSQTFTITNGGQQATGAMTVALGGTDKAEFQVTADGCDKQTLAVGTGSCQITVRFAPSGLGAKSASLTVSASPGGMAVAQLSATGITQGTLTITPSTKDFGSVQQLLLGGTQIFSVQNTGQATTGVLTTALSGDDSPNFSILANNCNGHTLASKDTCSVTVQFAPVTPGSKLVSLSVTGATGESGVAQLAGLALANASITIDPTTKSFNQVTVNQTASATFVVTNAGGVATVVPTVAVSGDTAADAGQFSDPDRLEQLHRRDPAWQQLHDHRAIHAHDDGCQDRKAHGQRRHRHHRGGDLVGNRDCARKAEHQPAESGLRLGRAGGEGHDTGDVHGDEHRGLAHGDPAGQHRRLDGVPDHGRHLLDEDAGLPGSCTVAVIFAPTSAAPSGTLQIVATNPADSTSAALSGTGLAPPKLTITPTSASFSDTVVNQTNPTTASFTIRNSGGVAAGTGTALVASISGTNLADFASRAASAIAPAPWRRARPARSWCRSRPRRSATARPRA